MAVERRSITLDHDGDSSDVSSKGASTGKGVMDEKTLQVNSTALDVEAGTTEPLPECDDAGYHRGLERRQVMMMTFGAGIGTGLWVGTGQALLYAGPAGTAVAYTICA